MARKRKKNQYKNKPKKEKSGRRWLTWVTLSLTFFIMTAAAGFLFIFVYDFFTQSPYFAATTLEVTGNERLCREEILKAAGLYEGINVLSVELTTIRKRLENHSWIYRARVSRRLPDLIAIHVEERVPLAILDLGERFLIDENGEIFKRWKGGDPDRLPVVTGLTFSDISVAGEPKARPFASLVEFLRESQMQNWYVAADDIMAIYVDRDTGLSMAAFDPAIAVRMGFGEYKSKLGRLHQVLFKLTRNRGIAAASVDMSNADRAVVLPRKINIYKNRLKKNV